MLRLISCGLLLLVEATAQQPGVIDFKVETIQHQCGVYGDAEVTRTQAGCIASRLGVGRETLWVTQPPNDDSVWYVMTVDGDEPNSEWERGMVWIARVGGRVQGRFPFKQPTSVPTDEIEIVVAREPTIQEQCGIRPYARVLEDDARCIARRIGMPDGESPWTYTQLDQGRDSTMVSVILSVDAPAQQYRVIVDNTGGRIEEILNTVFGDSTKQPSN